MSFTSNVSVSIYSNNTGLLYNNTCNTFFEQINSTAYNIVLTISSTYNTNSTLECFNLYGITPTKMKL